MSTILTSWLGPLIFAAAVVAIIAAVGRYSVPRAERLPVMRWGWRDLVGNVVIGVRVLLDLGEGRNRDESRSTQRH